MRIEPEKHIEDFRLDRTQFSVALLPIQTTHLLITRVYSPSFKGFSSA